MLEPQWQMNTPTRGSSTFSIGSPISGSGHSL